MALFEKIFDKFHEWRYTHIKERPFMIFVSFLVGVCTATAAYIIKHLIHFIQNFLTHNATITGANYSYLIYPVIGLLLASLYVKYIVKDDISHGITKVLFAISQRKA